jgi:hypothetical protein
MQYQQNSTKTMSNASDSNKYHNQNDSNQPAHPRTSITAVIINNIGMVMLLILQET